MTALNPTQVFLDATTAFFTGIGGDQTLLQLQAEEILKNPIMKGPQGPMLLDVISRLTGQSEAFLRTTYMSPQHVSPPTAATRTVARWPSSSASSSSSSAAAFISDRKHSPDGTPYIIPAEYTSFTSSQRQDTGQGDSGIIYDEKGEPVFVEDSTSQGSAGATVPLQLPPPIVSGETAAAASASSLADDIILPPPIATDQSSIDKATTKALEVANRAIIAAMPVVKKLSTAALKFAKENPVKTLAYGGLIATGIYQLGWIWGGVLSTAACYAHHVTSDVAPQGNINPQSAAQSAAALPASGARISPPPATSSRAASSTPAGLTLPPGTAPRAASSATTRSGPPPERSPAWATTLTARLSGLPLAQQQIQPNPAALTPGLVVPTPVPAPRAASSVTALGLVPTPAPSTANRLAATPSIPVPAPTSSSATRLEAISGVVAALDYLAENRNRKQREGQASSSSSSSSAPPTATRLAAPISSLPRIAPPAQAPRAASSSSLPPRLPAHGAATGDVRRLAKAFEQPTPPRQAEVVVPGLVIPVGQKTIPTMEQIEAFRVRSQLMQVAAAADRKAAGKPPIKAAGKAPQK